MDDKEIRIIVCEGCTHNRDIDNCAIYELCSIDYRKRTCNKKVKKGIK